MTNFINLRSYFIIFMICNLLAACAVIAEKESTGEYLDDAAITAKVKASIIDDPLLSGIDIGVETLHNVVQLSGFVNSQAQRNRAEKLAGQVAGVRSVRNNLIVYKRACMY